MPNISVPRLPNPLRISVPSITDGTSGCVLLVFPIVGSDKHSKEGTL